MKKICIIPARGGSKRIAKKNIKEFYGKPIIAYSIELAINSNLFDEIMVSTDDIEISKISKKYGASVPFLRSQKNSNDYASTYDVIEEVIKNYNNENIFFDYICCLYPAAPLIQKKIFFKCFKQIEKNINTSVLPITRFEHPIRRAIFLKNEKIKFLSSQHKNKRTQDIETFYHDTGQFYWINTIKLLKFKELITEDSFGYIIPSIYAQDIDNLDDWKLAEIKYEFLKK